MLCHLAESGGTLTYEANIEPSETLFKKEYCDSRFRTSNLKETFDIQGHTSETQ